MSSWFSSLSSSISSFAQTAVDTAAGLHSVTSRAYISEVSCGLEPVDPSKKEGIRFIRELARASELSRQVYNFVDMSVHEDCTLIRSDSPVIVGFYEKLEGTVWICCRGTHSPVCLLFDFSWLQEVVFLKGTEIRVPRMIAQVVQEEMQKILTYVQTIAKNNEGRFSKLRFTGHSLGGYTNSKHIRINSQ